MLEEYNITQTTLKILELYANNYKKSLHLREISREIKADVKTTQLQLKKLEKANILLSTTRGRNKEYALNLRNIITKYYVNMAEIFTSVIYLKKNFIIKKVISEIDNKIDGIIILFGSFVKGGHTKESDIDLFVITEKKIDRSLVLRTANLIGHEISLKSTNEQQFLNGMKNRDPLISEIISNHIVLKGADSFCDMLWKYNENR
jgi:predicted nucleotidyltransferase